MAKRNGAMKQDKQHTPEVAPDKLPKLKGMGLRNMCSRADNFSFSENVWISAKADRSRLLVGSKSLSSTARSGYLKLAGFGIEASCVISVLKETKGDHTSTINPGSKPSRDSVG